MYENFGWLNALSWQSGDVCVDCGQKSNETRFIRCMSTCSDETICKSCFQKRLIKVSKKFEIHGVDYRWGGENDVAYEKLENKYKDRLRKKIGKHGEDEKVIAVYRKTDSIENVYVVTTAKIIIVSEEKYVPFSFMKSIGYNKNSIEIVCKDIDISQSCEKKKYIYNDAHHIAIKEIPIGNRKDFCEIIIHLIYLFGNKGYCYRCNRDVISEDTKIKKSYRYRDIKPCRDGSICDTEMVNEFLNMQEGLFHPILNDGELERNYILLCPSCFEKNNGNLKSKLALGIGDDDNNCSIWIREIYPWIRICDQCRSVYFQHKFMEIRETHQPVKFLCDECFHKTYPASEYPDKLVHSNMSAAEQETSKRTKSDINDSSHGIESTPFSNNQRRERMELNNRENNDMSQNSNPWAELLASIERGNTETERPTMKESATASMNATETKNSWAELLAVAEHGVNKEGKVENLDSLMEELNSLIGLAAVKEEIHSLINIIQINNRRKSLGIATVPMSKHLVFSGNPGTGKTTVARLLAKIYGKLDILSKGHLIEVDRAGLVAGYVGQTATKTLEVIQKALGGILFIDEAYSLTVGKGDTDYGFEAVDTLLKAMEDHRDDLVVVVAGYPDQMEEFLESNPGLRSRFNTFIHFEDYKPDELLNIFRLSCRNNHYHMGEGVEEHLTAVFTDMYEHRGKDFANGREVRNLFEKSIARQANRLAREGNLDDEKLVTLEVADF